MPLFHQMFILKGICNNSGTSSTGWTKRELFVLCVLETHISNRHYFFLLFFLVHFFHICLIWIALQGTSSWTWHLVSICENESQVCLRKKELLTYPLAFFTDTLEVRGESSKQPQQAPSLDFNWKHPTMSFFSASFSLSF